ncbi:MAG: PFL family protein [Kiritimatiellae bacterium]|nr:PFL family protein [Kiritimatiellia bacterium]MDD5519805.1 PFL family protein [Kiritimatiellia bacterium]
MLRKSDILSTIRMLQEENLDVRTVTMGINLVECAGRNMKATAAAVEKKIKLKAGNLVRICDELSTQYGLPVVNKRLAISPASLLLEGHGHNDAVLLARAMDKATTEVKVDLIGGFTALVQKGMTPGEKLLIESLPAVLSQTARVCASVNVATTKAGMNVDAIKLMGQTILRIAHATKNKKGFGAAKLVVFANIPEDNPFMAGAFLGTGEPECVINVGVSGPGVVKRSIDRLVKLRPGCTLDEIAEEAKQTAFRVTRTGELIGREVAERLGVQFGVVDLSLAPTPRVGDSVGEIYMAMGISKLGAPGTTAAVALLNDAVKKGGAFASSSVGGMSGAFIPVMEDHALARAVANGTLTMEKLEAMTAVCSVGLDMILLPGNTSAETICGIIMDEAAIGMINRKTTGVRIIPVPGKKVGEKVDFGGLFGSGTITNVNCPDGSEDFVNRGGHIPAPIQSLGN